MKTKFGPRRSRGFLYKSLFMHEIFQYIYIYIYLSKEDIFLKKISKPEMFGSSVPTEK